MNWADNTLLEEDGSLTETGVEFFCKEYHKIWRTYIQWRSEIDKAVVESQVGFILTMKPDAYTEAVCENFFRLRDMSHPFAFWGATSICEQQNSGKIQALDAGWCLQLLVRYIGPPDLISILKEERGGPVNLDEGTTIRIRDFHMTGQIQDDGIASIVTALDFSLSMDNGGHLQLDSEMSVKLL